ncbi:MAG: hypothetical protein R3F49_13230 [Planctomycetota bacterium]
MTIASFVCPLPLLALGLLTAPVLGDVIPVGPVSGTTPRSDLVVALTQAQDGDTLLVGAGVYAAFDLADRAVDIVAREGALVRVVGSARVRDLDAGKEVVLSGLRFEGDDYPSALEIAACHGSVRVVDCTFRGTDTMGRDGCSIVDSSDVALFGVDIEGGTALAGFCAETSGRGLVVDGSVVSLYSSAVRGGRPRIVLAGYDLGGDGGEACAVTGTSELRAFSAHFTGGAGGQGDAFGSFCPCGVGGAGLVVDATSTVELLAGSTTGGSGGLYNSGPNCPPGLGRVGPVTDVPGPARRIQLERIAYGGGQLDGVIRGVPGEAVVLVLSLHAAHVVLPNYHNVLLTGSPYFARGVPVGVIPASGQMGFSAGVVGFGSSLLAEHMYVQPLYLGTAQRWLGDGDVVSLLAPWL